MPGVWRTLDGNVAREFYPRNTAQTIADDLHLGSQLCFVAQLLKIAAAAATEVRTGRLDAHRRRLEDFHNRSEGHAALHALDAD
jgi:hypothetical protein